jgi:hypothetical protein
MSANNLDVARQLAAVLASQAKLFEDVNSKMQSQAQILAGLGEQLSKLDFDGVNAGLQGMAQAAQAAGKAVGDTFSHLGSSIGDASGELDTMDAALGMATLTMKEALDAARKSATGYGTHAEKTGIATRGVFSLKEALKGSIASFLAVSSTVAGTAGSIARFAKAVISIPFGILDGLIQKADALGGDDSFARELEEVRKQFGSFKQSAASDVVTAFKTINDTFKTSGLGLFQVFGNMTQQLQRVRELATALGPVFNTVGEEFRTSAGFVLGFQKALGLTDEQMKEMRVRSIALGTSLVQQQKEFAITSRTMSEKFGLSAKMVSRDMAALAKSMSSSNLSTTALATAATYMQKLGIESNKVVEAMKKFDTLEGGAEAASQLAQAFGASVDAFDLMNTDDLTERFAKLQKQVGQSGYSFESMNRQQREVLKSITGLDDETIALGFSQKGLAMSYEDVQKEAAKSGKQQMSTADALKRVADQIERMIQSGGNLGSGNYVTRFFQGFEAGIENSREFMKLLMNVKITLRDTYLAGAQAGRAFVASFPGVKDAFTSLAALFDPKRFKVMLNGIVSAFKTFYADATSGNNNTFVKLYENIRDSFMKWFDLASPEGQRTVASVKKFLESFAKIAQQGVKFAGEKIVEGLKTISDALSGKNVASAGGALGAAVEWAKATFGPIVSELGNQIKLVLPALLDFVGTVLGKFYDALFEEPLKSYTYKIGAGLALAIMGPGMLRGFAQATPSLLISSAKGISGLVGSGLTKAVASQAAGAVSGVGAVQAAAGHAAEVSSKASPSLLAGFMKGLLTLALVLPAVYGIGKIMIALAQDAKGLSFSDIVKTITGVAGVSLAMVPVAFALKLVSQVPVGEVLKGGLALTAIAALIGGMTYGLMKLSKVEYDPKALPVITDVAMAVTKISLLAGVLAVAAAGIGLIASNPAGAGAMAVGLSVIGLMVTAIGASTVVLIETASQMPAPESIKGKLEIMSLATGVIKDFAGSIGGILAAAGPSLADMLKTGPSFTEKLDSMSQFISEFGKSLVGITTQILGIITSFAPSVGEKTKEAASLIGSMLGAVGTLATALRPPPELVSAGLLDQVFNGGVVGNLSAMSKYVDLLTQNLKSVLINIVTKVKELAAGLPSDPGKLKGMEIVTQLIGSIGSIAQSIVPSGDAIKSLSSVVDGIAGKFGAVSGDTKKFDALTAIIEANGNIVKAVVPELVSGTLAGAIAAAGQMSPKQLEGTKAVISVASGLAGLFNSISSVLKSTPQVTLEKKDGDKLTKITTASAGLGETLTDFAVQLPGIIKSLVGFDVGVDKGALERANGIGQLAGSLSKVFEAVGKLSTAAPTDGGAVAGIASAANTLNTLFSQSEGAFGTNVGPLRAVVNVLTNDSISFEAAIQSGAAANVGMVDLTTVISGMSANLVALSSAAPPAEIPSQLVGIATTIGASTEAIEQIGTAIQGWAAGFAGMADAVNSNAIAPAIGAIADVVAKVNELNDTLANADGNRIRMTTRLEKFAANSGLGSKAKYEIKNKDVNISIDLKVVMEAGKTEQVLIERKSSVIRQHLVNATYSGTNGDEQGGSTFPSKTLTSPNLPNLDCKYGQ